MVKVAIAPTLVLLCLMSVALYSLWTSRETSQTLERLTKQSMVHVVMVAEVQERVVAVNGLVMQTVAYTGAGLKPAIIKALDEKIAAELKTTQQRIDRLRGALRQALRNDGVKRAADELLHQAVGGVVAAGEFAVVASGASLTRQADKAEAAGVQVHLGHEFEQAFVHAAEFFGAHVAVVDGGQRATAGGGRPAQGVHGGQQVGVGELGGVQVRALVRGKQAAQRGQAQAWLALA